MWSHIFCLCLSGRFTCLASPSDGRALERSQKLTVVLVSGRATEFASEGIL